MWGGAWKIFVCIVKANTLATSTIRVLEPILAEEGKKQRTIFNIKRLVDRNDAGGFKLYKDLYLPSEASRITLLKSRMCITYQREIGVVDMENFSVQTMLDPQDKALDFCQFPAGYSSNHYVSRAVCRVPCLL